MSYFEPPVLNENYFIRRAKENYFRRQAERSRVEFDRHYVRSQTLEDDKEDFVSGLISEKDLLRRVEARFRLGEFDE